MAGQMGAKLAGHPLLFRRLAAQDIVEITQANQIVDPSTAKGPIRIRRAKNFQQNS